jgi:tetratricopeptide (TPR) repeat protein
VSLNSAIDSAVDEKNDLVYRRAIVYYNSRNYEKAIEDYNFLLNQKFNSSKNYYERALCFIRLNKTREAIEDIKQAIQLGNKDAEKIYETVNPLRRRIVSYVTRCCNGSTSGAKGRGACSRNGGVCNWEEPIFEEYREY